METKRTRKCNTEDPKQLEQLIQEKREDLVRKRLEAPTLRADAQKLRMEVQGMTRRWQVRQVADKLQQAAQLESEADVRESMKREYEFEETALTYLRMNSSAAQEAVNCHRKQDSIKCFKKGRDLEVIRSCIRDEYLADIDVTTQRWRWRRRVPSLPDGVGLLLQSVESTSRVQTADMPWRTLTQHLLQIPFDDVVDYAQYSYKRVNHFLMHLTLVQGREVHRVPNEIIQSVMKDLCTVKE